MRTMGLMLLALSLGCTPVLKRQALLEASMDQQAQTLSCFSLEFDFRIHVTEQSLLRMVPLPDGSYSVRTLPAGTGRVPQFDAYCNECSERSPSECSLYRSF